MIPFFAMFWLDRLGGWRWRSIWVNAGPPFTAGHSELTVVKSGPFKTKRLIFRPAEIENISASASNVTVNRQSVPELQVLRTGKTIGFLVGRDPDELRWIAMELSTALGLAPVAATNPDAMKLAG